MNLSKLLSKKFKQTQIVLHSWKNHQSTIKNKDLESIRQKCGSYSLDTTTRINNIQSSTSPTMLVMQKVTSSCVVNVKKGFHFRHNE